MFHSEITDFIEKFFLFLFRIWIIKSVSRYHNLLNLIQKYIQIENDLSIYMKKISDQWMNKLFSFIWEFQFLSYAGKIIDMEISFESIFFCVDYYYF